MFETRPLARQGHSLDETQAQVRCPRSRLVPNGAHEACWTCSPQGCDRVLDCHVSTGVRVRVVDLACGRDSLGRRAMAFVIVFAWAGSVDRE